jgi:formyltetrahydrofolate hydrolase
MQQKVTFFCDEDCERDSYQAAEAPMEAELDPQQEQDVDQNRNREALDQIHRHVVVVRMDRCFEDVLMRSTQPGQPMQIKRKH